MRPFARFRAPAVLLSFLALSAVQARAGEDDAVQVFKEVSPRVVSLQNAEGSGTGIILRADGLILTNAHVVNSPLPYTVTVDSMVAGKMKSVTFKKVTIVGYHPSLDLALVQIDPKENNIPLLPVEIAKTKGETGQRIYAIGNPGAGGKVLTKTITSGMLSAVDRDVDGANYYQIDAAVNPGNSGGPICDRLGKVLGLVTFKFEDVTAISFAIPLDKLDTKAFLPLAKRKGDPQKAAEYLKLADRYSDMAEQAGAKEGMDSDDRKLLNYYAAVCYRMALTEDPGNAAIYYNIGMLLRTLDDEDIAEAYLARAIQLEPWDASNGNPYREFGLCFAKHGKNAEATTIWKEGLAKHPYATKIYEDMAISCTDQHAFADAAYYATVGQMIPDHDARMNVLEQVAQNARKNLSAAQIAEVEARVERTTVIKSLSQALEASNKARQAKQVFITQAFGTLIGKIDGPPLAGVPDHISLTPAVAPKGLSLADIVPAPAAAPASPGGNGGGGRTASTPTPVSTKKTDPAPQPGDWITSAKPETASTPGKPATSTPPAAPPAAAVASAKPSAAVAGDQSFAGNRQKVNGATVVHLTSEDVVALAWSADAHSVFVLHSTGRLSKVSVPELKEIKHCTFTGKVSGLAASKSGLLVTCPISGEVWLVNEDLEGARRFPVSDARLTVSAPAVNFAYVAVAKDRLAAIDLSTGAVTGLDSTTAGKSLPDAHLFNLTPDGKYLFIESRGALERLRADGTSVVKEETGPGIAQNSQAVDISSDSNYVALPGGGGDEGLGPRSPYATYVFKANNLKTPVTTIASGAYPRGIAFDTKAHLIYAMNFSTQLRVYSPQGELQGDYQWRDHAGGVTNYLVHPDGKKLFVQSGKIVDWVELP